MVIQFTSLPFYSFVAIITSTLALCIAYLSFLRQWRKAASDRTIGLQHNSGKPKGVGIEAAVDNRKNINQKHSETQTKHGDLNTNDSVANNELASVDRGRSKANSERRRINSGSDGWKCACDGGGLFLPPNLMRSLGGPGAALRLGAGGCYHKQLWNNWQQQLSSLFISTAEIVFATVSYNLTIATKPERSGVAACSTAVSMILLYACIWGSTECQHCSEILLLNRF